MDPKKILRLAIRLTLLAILTLSACSVLKPAPTTGAAWTWTSYTTKDGLPSNHVMDIDITPEGIVWVATCSLNLSTLETPECFGISRFDGKTWTTYNKDDRLTDNYISSIAIAPNGMVWAAGGNNCISRFDGKTWTTYIGKAANYDSIWDIEVAPDGRVWVGVDGKLVGYTQLINKEGGDVLKVSDSIILDAGWEMPDHTPVDPNPVMEIAVAPDGAVWFSTLDGDGIRRISMDLENWTVSIYTTDDGLADRIVLSIAITPDGKTWAGTSNGVSHFDGKKWTTYTEEDGLVNNVVHSIAIASDGTVWFGAWDYRKGIGGVSHFDGKKWTSYTEEDGLASNYVTSIAVGPDGAVWFGTFDKGVSRYGP